MKEINPNFTCKKYLIKQNFLKVDTIIKVFLDFFHSIKYDRLCEKLNWVKNTNKVSLISY